MPQRLASSYWSRSSIARKAYERHGLANTAQWLNWQCGIGAVAAREKVRVARALEQLPEIARRVREGRDLVLEGRAMTRVAMRRTNRCSCTSRATARRSTSRSSCASTAGRSGAMPRSSRNCSTSSETSPPSSRRTERSSCTRGLPPEIGAVVSKALELARRSGAAVRRKCFRGNSAADRGACVAGRRPATHRRDSS